MEIVELNEKSNRMKKRKFCFDLCNTESEILYSIIQSNISTLQETMKKEEKEIEIVYYKDNYNRLSYYNELSKLLNEAILRKSSLEVTYELLDVLWSCINVSILYIRKNLERYGRTFSPESYNKLLVLTNITKRYEKDCMAALNKLYSNRKRLSEKINDYIDESAYNGFLIPSEEPISIHISMKEKQVCLQKIESVLYDIEYHMLKDIIIQKDDMEISIDVKEINEICNKVFLILTKNICSGSVFLSDIREYCILRYIFDGQV